MSHQHSTHITFTVGTVGDYDKKKLICALEGFANQFDLLDENKKIDAASAQLAIEHIFVHASKKPKKE